MSLRELFWAGQKVYITEIFLPVIISFLVFVPLLVILFAFGFGRHYRLWRLGQADDRSGRWLTRLTTTLAVAVANVRIIRGKELYPGVMHLLIFGGAAVLILGKIVRLFSYLTGITNRLLALKGAIMFEWSSIRVTICVSGWNVEIIQHFAFFH